MQKIPVNVIKPLLHATNQYISYVKSIPLEEQFIFKIEGILVLNFWDPFYKKICADNNLHSDDKELPLSISCSRREIGKMAFYFHHMALFFSYYGKAEDISYIEGVTHFIQTFANLKGAEGSDLEEKLFRGAFK